MSQKWVWKKSPKNSIFWQFAVTHEITSHFAQNGLRKKKHFCLKRNHFVSGDNRTSTCTTLKCYGLMRYNYSKNVMLEMCNCLPDCTSITYDVDLSQVPPNNLKESFKINISNVTRRYDRFEKFKSLLLKIFKEKNLFWKRVNLIKSLFILFTVTWNVRNT